MRRLLLTVAIAAATVLSAPMMAKADDNSIAQFIMQKLKVEQQRGNLRGFHVDMRVDKGTVWFEGYVSNAQQEQMILRTAQQAGHLGVVQVVDDINVRATQAQLPPVQQAKPVSFDQVQNTGSGAIAQPIAQPVAQQIAQPVANRTMVPGPMGSAPMRMQNSNGPRAVGYNSHGAAMATDHPQLPGYAWPGYAAHPNYAAVSYPKQYSPTAWPYIGPFYPYPQVPLGWRKVTLEWDDGWWMLDFSDR